MISTGMTGPSVVKETGSWYELNVTMRIWTLNGELIMIYGSCVTKGSGCLCRKDMYYWIKMAL